MQANYGQATKPPVPPVATAAADEASGDPGPMGVVVPLPPGCTLGPLTVVYDKSLRFGAYFRREVHLPADWNVPVGGNVASAAYPGLATAWVLYIAWDKYCERCPGDRRASPFALYYPRVPADQLRDDPTDGQTRRRFPMADQPETVPLVPPKKSGARTFGTTREMDFVDISASVSSSKPGDGVRVSPEFVARGAPARRLVTIPLESVYIDQDGRVTPLGADLSRPLAKPTAAVEHVAHGIGYSDQLCSQFISAPAGVNVVGCH